MAAGLPQVTDCCAPACDTVTVQVPGPPGATGEDGADGSDGKNAFTTLSNSFTVPAVDANVTVTVADSSWMAIGQVLFIQTAGYFKVISKPSATSVTVQNLGYDGNAAAAAVIASGKQVSPAGLIGLTGDPGAPGGDGSSALTTKGDLLGHNGANAVRIAVGTDNYLPHADSGATPGIEYRKLDLSGAETELGDAPLDIEHGGTGQTTKLSAFNALSPTTQRGDMIFEDVNGDDVRLQLGAGNKVMTSDGSDPLWRQVTQEMIAAGGPMPRYGLLGSLINANFNITTDQAITILSGVTKYIIRRIVVMNASINLTTAAGGIYTNASKGGTIIVAAAQVYSALTTSAKFKDLTLEAVVGADIFTAGTIYLSLTTAQGAAATGDVFIFGENVT